MKPYGYTVHSYIGSNGKQWFLVVIYGDFACTRKLHVCEASDESETEAMKNADRWAHENKAVIETAQVEAGDALWTSANAIE